MIIDAHAHIFPEKLAEKASKSIGDFYDLPMSSDASISTLLQAEKAAGIDKTLVCSSAVTPSQVESINTFIATSCKENPSLIGFAAMHPDYEAIGEELDRVIELGLKGIKFHSDFQKLKIDEERAIPMYKEIAKRNLPVLFHTGDKRYDYSSMRRVYHLLDMVPDLRVIGAHFGGYSEWDDVLTLEPRDNVYMDTSSALFFMEKEKVYAFFEKFGIDHFFFGTDFPMWNPTEELERFYDLHLSKSEQEQILHLNFAHFLTK